MCAELPPNRSTMVFQVQTTQTLEGLGSFKNGKKMGYNYRVTTGLNLHGITPNGIAPTEFNPRNLTHGIEPTVLHPLCTVLYVKQVVTHFYIVTYYINWVTTSWTHSISKGLAHSVLNFYHVRFAYFVIYIGT